MHKKRARPECCSAQLDADFRAQVCDQSNAHLAKAASSEFAVLMRWRPRLNDAGGEKETPEASKRDLGMSPPAHDCALVLSDTEHE